MSGRDDKTTVEIDQLAIFRGMLQRSIDVGEAAKSSADAASAQSAALRAEADARGLRQDNAIHMVSEQVRSLGGIVEKHGKAIEELQEERLGITRHVSQTEEQITATVDGEKRARVLLEGDVEDLRLGVKAITSALDLRVPRPDGSMPPPVDGKKPGKTTLERQESRSKIAVILTAAVLVLGALKEAGFFEAAHGLIFGH